VSELGYLFVAFAVTWGGILAYIWTLRRSVQRLAEEVAALPEDGPEER
jgi:CcmD family protein